jgi:hypothetical protein
MSRVDRIRSAGALALVSTLALSAQAAHAQVRVDDLVVTTGVSIDAYEGNLASVTTPVVDSTESARARSGQLGVRGVVLLYASGDQRVTGNFDFGLRQFAAEGFSVRDFTPREFAGRVDLAAWQRLGRWGNVGVELAAHGRRVDDRPPMPLFLQPGFAEVRGALAWESPLIDGELRLGLRVEADDANYRAPERIRALDLLDRDSFGVEASAEWGTTSFFRVYTGGRRTHYPRQSSFDVQDPFRRDRTYTAGAEWRYQSDFILEIGVEGAVNRSNSRRPEYDAIALSFQAATPLPLWSLSANLLGTFTAKSYVEETEFARLVPGEEADNASVVFLDVGRPVTVDLDATVRLGWTRAETDIGDSYYERVGVSLLLNYRPFAR